MIFFIRYMISTQMQPTFAREVFPCLDEPAFKVRTRPRRKRLFMNAAHAVNLCRRKGKKHREKE